MWISLSRRKKIAVLVATGLFVVWLIGYSMGIESPWWALVPAGALIFLAFAFFFIPTGVEMLRTAPRDLRMMRDAFQSPTLPRRNKVVAVAIGIAGVAFFIWFFVADPLNMLELTQR